MRRFSLLLVLSLLLFGCDSGPGPNEDPMASFSYTPDDPRAGAAVTFTANANDPDGSIQGYEWSTSSGAQGTGSTFSHGFAEMGGYTVTLTVTDNRDGTATSSKTIEIRQRYSEVTVNSVTVTDMPFSNDQGQGWDSFSGPDVYYTAFNVPDQSVEAASGYYSDAGSSDLPLVYSDAPFTIEDLSKEYAIDLWDSDNNEDDYIGGVSYTFDELVGDYPETYTIQFGDISYEVKLEWGN